MGGQDENRLKMAPVFIFISLRCKLRINCRFSLRCETAKKAKSEIDISSVAFYGRAR